jgi:hypothetical protein
MRLSSRQKILWVTTGAQFLVPNPQNALFHGLARSARAESSALSLKTLDVQSDTSTEAVSAISRHSNTNVKFRCALVY